MIQNKHHIFGKRRVKGKGLPCERVDKCQAVGVKGLPGYEGHIRIVEKVSYKRKPYVLHMDTDLVGPPCFQGQTYKRAVIKRIVEHKSEPGAGVISVLKIYAPLNGGALCPGNGSCDDAFWQNRPPGYGQISAADGTVFNHFR